MWTGLWCKSFFSVKGAWCKICFHQCRLVMSCRTELARNIVQIHLSEHIAYPDALDFARCERTCACNCESVSVDFAGFMFCYTSNLPDSRWLGVVKLFANLFASCSVNFAVQWNEGEICTSEFLYAKFAGFVYSSVWISASSWRLQDDVLLYFWNSIVYMWDLLDLCFLHFAVGFKMMCCCASNSLDVKFAGLLFC